MRGFFARRARQALIERISSSDGDLRSALVARLLGCQCKKLKVEGPVLCAQGTEITVGEALYISLGCEISDLGKLQIGDCVVLGPGVKIRSEPGKPVFIGHRVWLGQGVEVSPGTTIGDDAIVCAGTRVEKNVDSRTVITGNPPRLLRTIR